MCANYIKICDFVFSRQCFGGIYSMALCRWMRIPDFSKALSFFVTSGTTDQTAASHRRRHEFAKLKRPDFVQWRIWMSLC